MWASEPSNNSQSQNQDLDRAVLGGGVVFAFVAVALFTVKYFPVFVLGFLFGFLLYAAKFHVSLTSKTRHVLFTLGFFALLLFVLLGLPFNFKNRWDGFLCFSPQFGTFCVYLTRYWNDLAATWLFGAFKKWQVTKLTSLSISQYVWLSYSLGAALSVLFFGLGHFGKFKSDISEFGLSLCSLPSKSFSLILDLLFSGWVRFGRSNRKESGGFLLQTLLVTALFGSAYYASNQASRLTPYFEFQFCLKTLSFGPITGLLLGFCLSFIPFGSKLIDLFFGKEVKIKQTELPGFYLGKTFQGRPYRLTERNLGYHVEIVAPTGSGKTNLLKNLIADRIQKGHGVIFLDFKAEFDIVSWIYRTAKSVNRENEIRLLSLSNRDLSVPYNPLKYGDPTDIQSALMNSMNWSEEFYRGIASVTLTILLRSLCEYRDRTGECFHLGHVYELLDHPPTIRELATRMAKLGCLTAPKLSDLQLGLKSLLKDPISWGYFRI